MNQSQNNKEFDEIKMPYAFPWKVNTKTTNNALGYKIEFCYKCYVVNPNATY